MTTDKAMYLVLEEGGTNTAVAAAYTLPALAGMLGVPLRTMEDGARSGRIKSRGYLIRCLGK
jgi:hypothetical protein